MTNHLTSPLPRRLIIISNSTHWVSIKPRIPSNGGRAIWIPIPMSLVLLVTYSQYQVLVTTFQSESTHLLTILRVRCCCWACLQRQAWHHLTAPCKFETRNNSQVDACKTFPLACSAGIGPERKGIGGVQQSILDSTTSTCILSVLWLYLHERVKYET